MPRQHRDHNELQLPYLKAGSPSETEAAEAATARRAQRDARAEAQMAVSDEVLKAEGQVNYQLTVAYRRLKRLERETDASVREPPLDEVIKLLDGIISMLSRRHVRVIMRAELGIIGKPPSS